MQSAKGCGEREIVNIKTTSSSIICFYSLKGEGMRTSTGYKGMDRVRMRQVYNSH